MAQIFLRPTSAAHFIADGGGHLVESGHQLGNFVAQPRWRLDDSFAGGKISHGGLQAFEPASDQKMQADTQRQRDDQDASKEAQEINLEPVQASGLLQPQVVTDQDQAATMHT
jgi:hypothetical protein